VDDGLSGFCKGYICGFDINFSDASFVTFALWGIFMLVATFICPYGFLFKLAK
jgi:hypothetical protein